MEHRQQCRLAMHGAPQRHPCCQRHIHLDLQKSKLSPLIWFYLVEREPKTKISLHGPTFPCALTDPHSLVTYSHLKVTSRTTSSFSSKTSFLWTLRSMSSSRDTCSWPTPRKTSSSSATEPRLSNCQKSSVKTPSLGISACVKVKSWRLWGRRRLRAGMWPTESLTEWVNWTRKWIECTLKTTWR